MYPKLRLTPSIRAIKKKKGLGTDRLTNTFGFFWERDRVLQKVVYVNMSPFPISNINASWKHSPLAQTGSSPLNGKWYCFELQVRLGRRRLGRAQGRAHSWALGRARAERLRRAAPPRQIIMDFCCMQMLCGVKHFQYTLCVAGAGDLKRVSLYIKTRGAIYSIVWINGELKRQICGPTTCFYAGKSASIRGKCLKKGRFFFFLDSWVYPKTSWSANISNMNFYPVS